MFKLSHQLVRTSRLHVKPSIVSLRGLALQLFSRSMATSSKIQLTLAERGVMKCPGATVEMATTASELLQENHEQHHIFFNAEGFHVRPPRPSIEAHEIDAVLTG